MPQTAKIKGIDYIPNMSELITVRIIMAIKGRNIHIIAIS